MKTNTDPNLNATQRQALSSLYDRNGRMHTTNRNSSHYIATSTAFVLEKAGLATVSMLLDRGSSFTVSITEKGRQLVQQWRGRP